MKACAAEIVRAGAALHDALGSEAQLRDARSRALAGTLEGEYVERSIGEAIAGKGQQQVQTHEYRFS